jgi:hypothetical protein
LPRAAQETIAVRLGPQNAQAMRQNSGLRGCAGSDDDLPSTGRTLAMAGVKNGLYTVETEMTDGGRGRATGIIVLVDGRIAGGDTHFYYTGSYTANNGKWRGELTTFQHQKPVGVQPLFGGREVTCGFTGTYADDSAIVSGTALVGKTSVMFQTRLKFRQGL